MAYLAFCHVIVMYLCNRMTVHVCVRASAPFPTGHRFYRTNFKHAPSHGHMLDTQGSYV